MPDEIKKILVIEDEEPIHAALGSVLSPDTYELKTATDGETGIQFAEADHPDLIILDIMLPGIDGVEVLRRIRMQDWGKDMKIIVLTNISDKGDEDLCKSLGVSEYYIKSNISLDEIAGKIKEQVM